MSEKAKYEALVKKYIELANRGTDGDQGARRDKQKVREELRAMERESAREGKPLSFGTKTVGSGLAQTRIALDGVRQDETDSKKDLQREYVRHFKKKGIPSDERGEPEVKINGEVTTLSAWHRRRLGV